MYGSRFSRQYLRTVWMLRCQRSAYCSVVAV
nr:MAG TPA: hypothetical protein [Caudoviricetes sp.]